MRILCLIYAPPAVFTSLQRYISEALPYNLFVSSLSLIGLAAYSVSNTWPLGSGLFSKFLGWSFIQKAKFFPNLPPDIKKPSQTKTLPIYTDRLIYKDNFIYIGPNGKPTKQPRKMHLLSMINLSTVFPGFYCMPTLRTVCY